MPSSSLPKESVLQRTFHLKERNTTVRTEAAAGLTTFMTMAYILAVNPLILSDAGMDRGAVFTATCIASIIATVLMALLSNYPFVLSAGMGLNAYFAYTVVLKMGYTWQMALAAVFVEGLIFVLLSLTSVREAIFNAIPLSLKHAVSAGIGLFIALIGLQNCGVVVDSTTLVGMYSFSDHASEFSTVGITVALALVGILLTSILMVRKVKGHILWGMLGTWGLGILCQLTGLYDPSVKGSLLPDFSNGLSIPSLLPTFGQMDFSQLFTPDFLLVVFALLFVDLFDTLGGIMGMSAQSGLLDKEGRLPGLKGTLMADAVGTTAGAILGTSTVTTFAESAAGIAEGGRTGLTSMVSAGLFGLSLFLAPIFLSIPAFATAPALVVVGFFMMSSIREVDFSDYTQSLPAFLCAASMPFFYSISEGIAMGVISYVGINLAAGPEKRRSLRPAICILALLFLLKYLLF